MKKLLLSLLTFVGLSLSFSNALDVSCSYTFDWDNYEYVGDCSPSSIPGVVGDYVLTISNFEFDLPACEEHWEDCFEYPDSSDLCLSLMVTNNDGLGAGRGGTCGYISDNFGFLDNPFDLSIYDGDFVDGDYLVFYPEIFNKSIDDYNYYYVDSFSFDLSIPGYSFDSDEPDDPDPDEPGTGGGVDEPDDPIIPDDPDVPVVPDSPSDNIVPDGSLVSVIFGVFSVFAELIPYIIYLGIGLLLCTVGFYAIRWLMNWLNDKIHKYF